MQDLEITPQQLLVVEHVLLVDVRNHDEWGICKLNGAILCPLPELDKHLDTIKSQAGQKEIVVYCHHGRRSLAAVYQLRKAGIASKSLRGGIDAWADIDPSMPRY